MKNIGCIILLGIGMMTSFPSWAEEAEFPLMKAPINVNDQASLQRGVKYYVNYCSGCHSLDFLRYKRMAQDIGITTKEGAVDDKLVQDNLIFTGAKMGDHMSIAMRKVDAAKWFGTAPPDLTLETRARGADWLYTYLNGFYRDAKRPWGVNNVVFKDVAMPHVLLNLQGIQEPIYGEARDLQPGQDAPIIGLKLTEPGSLKPGEYQQMTADLVNFLAYAAEPAKQTREHLGVWVLLYLVGLSMIAYLLKREYWKDVH
jgi:ubiquinol-cytochrome c reductase cytochrome c1 subunit